MKVQFFCSECGKELKTDERFVGRRARCPDCGTSLVVPKPAPADVLNERRQRDPPEAEAPRTSAAEPAAANIRAGALQPETVTEPPVVVRPPQQAPAYLVESSSAENAPPESPADEPFIALPLRRAHPEDLIDMTAMVDIVFFLLIFFLVTSLQSLEAVMNLPTPQSESGSGGRVRSVADLENDPTNIIVRIEDDDSIWVEDSQMFNDQDLRVRLRAARLEGSGRRSLLVIGDADASHGAAVRVFDAGAGAGVDSISFLVQERKDVVQ